MKYNISIIIPCYNMGKYLPICLDSIFAQTENLEIICIDDGSTDNTVELIMRETEKRNNLKLIQQHNQGSGIARNHGIMEAEGEYVAFIDADDFYPDRNVLHDMYNAAKENKANICGGSACSYRNGVYTYNGLRNGLVFSEDKWINADEFPTFAGFWRFIYKRDFLLQNKINFPNYLRCQDPPFFLAAIVAAQKVYCLKKITYCYRKEHKKVEFTEKKACDYAKGIRDSLEMAKKGNMKIVYSGLLQELHSEVSALMYRFAAYGCKEMEKVIHDINVIIENDANKLLENKAIIKYIDSIELDKKEFFEKIESAPSVLIYGAGIIGRKVLDFLNQSGVIPEAFVVSDTSQNPDNVEGVVVHNITDYIPSNKQSLILIATFPYLHEEIKGTLEKYGFTNVYAVDLEKFYLFQNKIEH